MEIEFNKLQLKLNKKNLTSSVINSPKATGDVFIPQYVEYERKKYNIISIEAFAFSFKKITSLSFPENSELISFGDHCFTHAEIQKLQIPPKLTHLGIGWCNCIKDLVEIEVSTKNKHYSYLNNEFLVGKSDPKIDTFDILHFARFDIVNAKIPSQIKEIFEYSFDGHKKLKSVVFSDDSNLKKIHENAFNYSTIQKLVLPSSVVEIPHFKNVDELVDITVSPENRYFSYLNDQILVKNEENKSILIFCRRDSKKAFIPSCITEIYPNAFDNFKIKEIIFEENSKLEKIGSYAFAVIPGSPSILIPKSVKKICNQAFICNENLKSVEIQSETIIIEYRCFECCSNLSIISFPNATVIGLDSLALEGIPREAIIYITKEAKIVF